MIIPGQFYTCIATTKKGHTSERNFYATSEESAFDKAYDFFSNIYKMTLDFVDVRENV